VGAVRGNAHPSISADHGPGAEDTFPSNLSKSSAPPEEQIVSKKMNLNVVLNFSEELKRRAPEGTQP
jgi:hypothetical protein